MNDRAFPFTTLRHSRHLASELKRRSWPMLSTVSPILRVVDLYCGCGGLSLGAYQTAVQVNRNLEIALAIDISAPAIDVFADNFSKLTKSIINEDITDYVSGVDHSKLSTKGHSLLRNLKNIDALLAGPPCQGNSDLNNSSRRNDPRNDLYLVPAVFAAKLLPNIVLIENVPTVIHGDSDVVGRSIKVLQSAGYSCAEFRADLTALGLPQTRRRHVLVASRIHSKPTLECLLASIPCGPQIIPLRGFISDLEGLAKDVGDIFRQPSRASLTNEKRIAYLFDHNLFDLPNEFRPPCHRDKKHSYVSMYGRLKVDEPAQTITSGFGSMGQGRFVHPTEPRTITPHEAARIQGFPDYFSFRNAPSITELRKMIGNAVAPVITSALLTTLLE